MRSIVPERDLMGVFGTVVEVAMLCKLVDEHKEKEAKHDALPEGV